MMITTDGKQFVFGVFTADGCECEFLDSVHGTEASAQQRLAELRSGEYCYGDKELANVKTLELK